VDAVFRKIDANHAGAIERLKAFLSIPSVSTDPAYASSVDEAATWVRDQLEACGLNAGILPTQGHPVVLADTGELDSVAGDTPTVLFYGHYDVQPPDPLEQWTSPPFEPTIRDGALYARGACDDKGQVSCFLEALRAWREAGRAWPCRVKILIEGEEEIGSANLPTFLERQQEQLAADVVVISDTAMWEPGDGPARVAITYALRGLVYFDVQLHGPDRDLHSGVYGGTLANPATELVRVLGRLFDDAHRVTIPGFYEDVDEPTPEELEQWRALGFDEDRFLGGVGAEPFGEQSRDTLSRRWARPACDINGLYGGYMGEGAKTVIPTFAGAKVSFRIPASMDPHKVAEQFDAWLRSHKVGDLRWRITRHGEAHPVATPLDSPHVRAASRAIERVTGEPPAMIREGATIPVVADFKRLLKAESLLVGFGLTDDRIHSPDEHFGLDRLHLGAKVIAAMLATLGEN